MPRAEEWAGFEPAREPSGPYRLSRAAPSAISCHHSMITVRPGRTGYCGAGLARPTAPGSHGEQRSLRAQGGIRTHTFHGLNVATPADWSTWAVPQGLSPCLAAKVPSWGSGREPDQALSGRAAQPPRTAGPAGSSGRRGSNPRPPPWQGGTLPTAPRPHELRARTRSRTGPSGLPCRCSACMSYSGMYCAPETGLEPVCTGSKARPGYLQPTPEWSPPPVPSRAGRPYKGRPDAGLRAWCPERDSNPHIPPSQGGDSCRLVYRDMLRPCPGQEGQDADGARACGRYRTACLPLTRGPLCQMSYTGRSGAGETPEDGHRSDPATRAGIEPACS